MLSKHSSANSMQLQMLLTSMAGHAAAGRRVFWTPPRFRPENTTLTF